MKLHKLTSLVFVYIYIAISLPFGCSLTLAQTTKEMQDLCKEYHILLSHLIVYERESHSKGYGKIIQKNGDT
jgi:hypothetical protein